MKSIAGQIYAIQSTNLTTQRAIIGQARFTLNHANAIIKTANNTEDAWFYEIVIPGNLE